MRTKRPAPTTSTATPACVRRGIPARRVTQVGVASMCALKVLDCLNRPKQMQMISSFALTITPTEHGGCIRQLDYTNRNTGRNDSIYFVLVKCMCIKITCREPVAIVPLRYLMGLRCFASFMVS